MSFIAQRGKTDCGVAALAMLCDVPYESVDRAILWRRHGVLFGTDTKMLREAAERLGYRGKGTEKNQLKRLGGKSWDAIPENSLVKIPHPDPKIGQWHWVAWRKGAIYDPALGVFKPKKYDRKPVAYMEFVPDWVIDCPECGTTTVDGYNLSGIRCPNCNWCYCL